MSKAERLFTAEGKTNILEAIKRAERNTSGELRVCIEDTTSGKDVLERALQKFYELEMDGTQDRNGVLFYLAVEDKKFAIMGDEGINTAVPDHFWDSAKQSMESHFRNGDFTAGLLAGIDMAGTSLQQYFPYDRKGDMNELPDEIIFE